MENGAGGRKVTEDALDIGDLDRRVRIDLLVTRRLALGVAVELEEGRKSHGAGSGIVQSVSQSVFVHASVCATPRAHTNGRYRHAYPPPVRPARPCRRAGRCAWASASTTMSVADAETGGMRVRCVNQIDIHVKGRWLIHDHQ